MSMTKKNKTRVTQKPDRAPAKRAASGHPTSMSFGNHTQIKGDFNFVGRDMITTTTVTGFNATEVRQLFTALQKEIEASAKISPTGKEDLRTEVQEIKAYVTKATKKQEPVDESFLARRFRNIARLAPDILEVVVTTLANPLLGLGEVAKRIASKARSETEA